MITATDTSIALSNAVTTGHSVIHGGNGSNCMLKSLEVGSNVGIRDDGGGVLTIRANDTSTRPCGVCNDDRGVGTLSSAAVSRRNTHSKGSLRVALWKSQTTGIS